jgi:GDP-4-dehydro-6-deoxy-D-mannose reductase
MGRYFIRHVLDTNGGAAVLGVGRTPESARVFTHTVNCGPLHVAAPVPEEVRADPSRARYVPLDLGDRCLLEALLRDFRPDVVAHLAGALRDDPLERLLASNVIGTANLLEAIAASGLALRKFVLCSSGGVYGRPARVPIDEQDRCRPVDLYSASKLAAEHVASAIAEQHRIPVVCARVFNLVGAGQHDRHACAAFAAQAAVIRCGLAAPVIKVGALETTRDFIDVRDAARALLLLADSGTPGEAYNVAAGVETPMERILELTLALSGLEGAVAIERAHRRESDIPRHFAHVGRLRALGFAPRYELRQSLADMLDYYTGIAGEPPVGRASVRAGGTA